MIFDIIRKLNASTHFGVAFSAVDIKCDDWICIKLHYLDEMGCYPHPSVEQQKQIERGQQLIDAIKEQK